MAKQRGVTATLIDRRRRILALWIEVRSLRLLGPSISSIAKEIKKLQHDVPGCIKDYIVVDGTTHSNAAYRDEILVIVNANQPAADLAAFNTLTSLVRKQLGGAYTEIQFPEDRDHDPRAIYDDRNRLGWRAVKR